MQKTLLLLLSSIVIASSAGAQTNPLFNASEYIDIANIRAAHLVHGDMWWRPEISGPACEFPKGSGKNVGFVSSIWIAGYDNSSVLHVAAQAYRQNGTDYWPGPIDSVTSSVSYATSQKWAKIWKVIRSTIDSFNRLSTHTLVNTPSPILEWPAIGNPYAKGNAGVAITVTQALAPFVDINHDGRYNPIDGDYPLIKGDQMLWWVINDAGPTRTVSNTTPFPVDIRVSAYAYARGGTIDNIVFYEFLVRNAGGTVSSFQFGTSDDMDLGNAFDDYAGFDSSRRIGYNYNGNINDGNGAPGTYGTNIPAAGAAIMEFPGDSFNYYTPAGSFVVINNSTGPNGDPQNGTEILRVMNSSFRTGAPLPNNARYEYVNDSECILNTVPGDRRFVIACQGRTLEAGATLKFGMALVVSPEAGGCPNFDKTGLLQATDTAYKYYWHPLPGSQPTSVFQLNVAHSLRLYPNPSSHVLYVDADRKWTTIGIYNALGQPCTPPVGRIGNKFEVITETLPSGVYTVRCTDSDGVGLGVFVKQ